MAISQGGSSLNLQFTSSKYPGKETETPLTAAESSDMMGLREHKLQVDEELQQEVKVVPWRFLPAQQIKRWKLDHNGEMEEHI